MQCVWCIAFLQYKSATQPQLNTYPTAGFIIIKNKKTERFLFSLYYLENPFKV